MFANTTILRLLGFDAERVPEDTDVALQFMHLPESWGVFVLIAVAGGLLYLAYHLYKREKGDCPKWARADPSTSGTSVTRSAKSITRSRPSF